MKRNVFLSLLLAVSILTVPCAGMAAEETAGQTETAASTETDSAAQTSETGIWPEIAGENGITYDNLFSVILDDSCKDIWYEKCEAIVGEEKAEATVEALQGAISGDLYGQEAIDAYKDADSFSFDCWYINGAKAFTFHYDDDVMTADIEKTDGTTETHTYDYIGVYQIGAGETMSWGGQEFSPAFDCDVYQSTDDAGEFTYFFLRDDTMATTWHIEFRYGDDLEELQGYLKGKYAYWLAAGFDQDADEETLENVIGLFCEENAA